MANKKARKQTKTLAQPAGRRNRMVIVALIIALAASTAIIARRAGLSPAPPPASAEPAPQSQPGLVKEYAYAGGKLLVTEEEPGASCSPSIDQTGQSFAASSTSGSSQPGTISVTAAAGCSWTAVSNAAWITITGGATGSGNGAVSYSVAVNTATSNRSGTITAAGSTFTVYQGAAFLDVPLNHPFFIEIGKLSARGVTTGCGGGLYCPDSSVNHGQMAAFVMRAKGEFNPPPPSPPTQSFADVPPSHYFYNFIERMGALGIWLGCPSVCAQCYCPDSLVTREQMAPIMVRGIGEFDPPTPGSQRFNDVPPSNPYYNFIDRMAVLEITLGCGGGNYCPANNVTRGQMAAFLVRAFHL